MPSDQETTIANTTVVNETTPATNGDVASVEEGHKVFVGNLSFQTKEEGLISFFETSGKVLDAKIITIRRRFPKRFPRRSAGYGFVTFATLEDATKATQELNKKELDGREINVEVARPKPERTTTTDEHAENEQAGENDAATENNQRSRPNRKFRGNKPRRSRSYNKRRDSGAPEDTEESDEQSKEANNTTTEKKKRQVNNKKTREAAPTTGTTDEDNESVASDTPITRRPRRNFKGKRPFKKRGNFHSRPSRKVDLTIPSETTLFVANLPYASTDETLQEVFKSYKVVSATVNRMRNGRSKGYGFVEFESQAEQVKALENVKDVELEGRTIYLSIALSEAPKDESKEENDESKEQEQSKEVETKKEEPKKENGDAKK
ncbi:hypothetical protein BJ944DRAFT_176350 [Cunninghamella echinulata]|nr:hypothetical protein BJ944DRAFT_176350 [Cunninghamella echinulata]